VTAMRLPAILLALALAAVLSSCGWQGLNSLPMPGTEGGGPGSYVVQAELADVTTIQPNSRVRIGDVNVGTVTKVELQGWHALITMRLNGDVTLPANAIATIGQTSLLGSTHVEVAAPTDAAPQGRLHNGSLIPLSSSATYPTTEQTLAAVSLLLNGGGIGRIEEITRAFSTAFAGREKDLRSLVEQLDRFATQVSTQKNDIIMATESLNRLTGQFAEQKPVVDRALVTIPDALAVLNEQRTNLADALDAFGKFSAVTTDAVNNTKENLVKELNDIGPVLESLANAGSALTRSFSFFLAPPWAKETLQKWWRGDFANLTAVIDLTLSRLDSSLFTGTRFECQLTQLELQWGRTIGQKPSPCTAANPLVAPYRTDQGP